MAEPIHVAIIGSGNIGTDLMIKVLRGSGILKVTALVGIDPESDGLRRADSMGVTPIATGVDGLIADPVFDTIDIVFDATSAKAHVYNAEKLQAAKPGIRLIDLTPAAIGPYCVPVVNLEEHIDAPNLNMVTCGGQATIPMVAAVSSVAPVRYAEIVASISSKSAGPGTRANIDEFTETTSEALQTVGGAERGKAIIVLNPAEPPLMMRDTVFTLSEVADQAAIEAAVEAMVAKVNAYVSGYRLKQQVQFDLIEQPINIPGIGQFTGLKTSIFLEVEGAAHYLPAYAGNLDVLGTYFLGVESRIPSAFFVSLLGDFELSESAARNAISRVARQGFLVQSRQGRTTHYSLTERAKQRHARRLRAIVDFGRMPKPWNGFWSVLALSVAEDQRAIRHQAKQTLRQLGFGSLYDGVWVSPWEPTEGERESLEDLGVDRMTLFTGISRVAYTGSGYPTEAFQLDEARVALEQFIEKGESIVDALEDDAVPPTMALRLRTELLRDWRNMAEVHPVLPDELLPELWPLARARALLEQCYDGLAPAAEERMRHHFGGATPELCEHVRSLSTADVARLGIESQKLGFDKTPGLGRVTAPPPS